MIQKVNPEGSNGPAEAGMIFFQMIIGINNSAKIKSIFFLGTSLQEPFRTYFIQKGILHRYRAYWF